MEQAKTLYLHYGRKFSPKGSVEDYCKPERTDLLGLAGHLDSFVGTEVELLFRILSVTLLGTIPVYAYDTGTDTTLQYLNFRYYMVLNNNSIEY